MIALDTTVLLYAVGTEHRYREPARAIVAALGEGAIRATTTVEVIQEFAQVRSRRRDREDASRLARQFVQLLAPLLPVEDEHLDLGLTLFERKGALRAFDAVLAATALGSGIDVLVSADRAFAEVPGLTVVPLEEAASTLGLANAQ